MPDTASWLLAEADGTNPRPYQHEGVNWITTKLRQPDTRAVLLADDPGLGKTLQALCAAHELQAQRILIVSPAVARLVWRAEILRWFPQWRERVVVVQPGAKPDLFDLTAPNVILVLAYDALSDSRSPIHANLARVTWDLLILDEGHYLKSGGANRTRAIYGTHGHEEGIQATASRVLVLTGTPAPNHCGELYHHIRALWPQALIRLSLQGTSDATPRRPLSEPEFIERYTRYKDTRFGRQIIGSQRQDELRQRVGPYVLRRTKGKVLPELPPLITQDVPLDLTPEQMTSGLTGTARVLTRSLTQLEGDELLQHLNRLNTDAESMGVLSSLRRQLGAHKLPGVLSWAEERLACGVQKLILFAWHHETLSKLRDLLREYDPVMITGDTSPKGRQTAIDLFQYRASVRIFLGQIQAAGTAITLTSANEVAIVEPSWVPSDNYQAICRAHRLGQRDSVLASFLYVPSTLDEAIMRTFRRKAVELARLEFEQTGSLNSVANPKKKQGRSTQDVDDRSEARLRV